MKTAREFWYSMPIGTIPGIADIEARDAEHRAELAAAIDQAAQDARERARVEIGRLNRLLTDQARNCAHRETADRLSNQVESERALRAIDQEEIERLKGELAEARDQLAEAEDMIDDAMEHGGDIDQKRAKKFIAAPPPAESPVPMRCTASAGSCNSPKACGEAGRCIDARMREFVGPAESMPVQLTVKIDPVTGEPLFEPAPPDDIRARLERLESEVRYLADTSTHGAMVTLENRVAALEAKGEPGTHVFVCDNPRRVAGDPCCVYCRCGICGEPDGPPHHPKGAKP